MWRKEEKRKKEALNLQRVEREEEEQMWKSKKEKWKCFGVWCDNTKYWVPQIPFNYQIAIELINS